MIRVLVVDDSATVRGRLIEILRDSPDFTVVGEAADGRRAIELCKQLRPDVVTLDLVLPELDGLAVTEDIMAHQPTPILIVSASMNRGEVVRTYDALAAGAVDVLDKAGAADEEWDVRFLSAVRMVSRIKVITHPRARLRKNAPSQPPIALEAKPAELIALGASTGGPGALAQVIAAIPSRVHAPIVLVLHIDAAFAQSFAGWLDGMTSRDVRIANHGEPLAPDRVYVSPSDRHLTIVDGECRLIDAPPVNHCKPSVDVLFQSVATACGPRASAALLTGMGRDGAEGLLAIRKAGGLTIAQDEATCVVYGMPREAALRNAAVHVAPLDRIGALLGGDA